MKNGPAVSFTAGPLYKLWLENQWYSKALYLQKPIK